jgi:hypothetical protein
VPKAGRKWEPQGPPRSEARVHATLHPWRKAHTAISSASTLTIATALDEKERRESGVERLRTPRANTVPGQGSSVGSVRRCPRDRRRPLCVPLRDRSWDWPNLADEDGPRQHRIGATAAWHGKQKRRGGTARARRTARSRTLHLEVGGVAGYLVCLALTSQYFLPRRSAASTDVIANWEPGRTTTSLSVQV